MKPIATRRFVARGDGRKERLGMAQFNQDPPSAEASTAGKALPVEFGRLAGNAGGSQARAKARRGTGVCNGAGHKVQFDCSRFRALAYPDQRAKTREVGAVLALENGPARAQTFNRCFAAKIDPDDC